MRANIAAGITVPASQPKGADSPMWKGGEKASVRRRVESGAVREYRRNNPERFREYSQRRSSRKLGRLPRGTVAKLRERQRDRCAICARSISQAFHVDHIMPLALGGKHEALNVQLLCPTCNVRKQAKHPIRYAQEIGRLL